MKYVIYNMVQPSSLTIQEPDGYYINTIKREVLERLDVPNIDAVHSSMESALAEIKANAMKLRYMKLTVLPVIEIDWDGVIETV